MAHRVYISASTQKENIGVLNYGTEQDRMMQLADRVAYWLKTQKGNFEVFRNSPGWTLEQTVNDCNNLACALFIDNHTNAGGPTAQGTEVYFHQGSVAGQRLAQTLFDAIAPLSLGKDRGVIVDTTLYTNGFYVLRKTAPPAALIEHIYHTNAAEVVDYLAKIDEFAKAEAKAICKYFGLAWIEPVTQVAQTVEGLVDDMMKTGLITDREHWLAVLKGQQPAKPEFLQIVFRRAVQKR